MRISDWSTDVCSSDLSSADVVLTFRNVHNWRFGGVDKAADAFKQIFAMLKPGGTLGVAEHRLDERDDSAKEEKSGYLKESTVIALAEAEGFKIGRASGRERVCQSG